MKKRVTLKASEAQLNWAKVLGVVPVDVGATNGTTPNKLWAKLYPAFILLINVVVFGFVIYGRLHHYGLLEISNFITQLIADVILFVCSSLAIIIVNYGHLDELKSMIAELNKMEHERKYKKGQTTCHLMQFMVVHITWFVFLACNIAQIVPIIPWYIKYFMLRELQNYHIIITTMVMRIYVLIIKGNFEYLNSVISSLRTPNFLTADLTNSRNKMNIDMISAQYTKLTFVIRQYNEVYGTYFVLIYIYIIINLLVPMNLAAVYGGGEVPAAGHRLGPLFIANCVIWTLLPLIIFRELFLSCESVMLEIDKMPENCFRIMASLGEKQKYDVRELAIQTGLSRPVFSAGGWFDINYKMILPTVTMIISYLIVLIQYHD